MRNKEMLDDAKQVLKDLYTKSTQIGGHDIDSYISICSTYAILLDSIIRGEERLLS